MFYFIYGDTPLPLKYEELIKKIQKENPNIPTQIYDASSGEEQLFLQSISTNSMFIDKELIVLKRAEKYKKLEELLKFVGNYNLIKKEVVMVYEEYLNDYDKPINEVGKRILSKIDKLGKIIVARKKNERKSLQFYIENQLGISETEAIGLFEIIGDDFFKIKNEIEKIKNYLNGDIFILENVLPILSISVEYNVKKLLEDFMLQNNLQIVVDYLEKTREYMLFLHIMSEELNLALKIVALNNSGYLTKNISYKVFKDIYYDNIKKYFKTNRGFMREYPIFLKLKYIGLFSESKLLDLIKKLLETEYLIKTGQIDEKIGIEKFLIEFKL